MLEIILLQEIPRERKKLHLRVFVRQTKLHLSMLITKHRMFLDREFIQRDMLHAEPDRFSERMLLVLDCLARQRENEIHIDILKSAFPQKLIRPQRVFGAVRAVQALQGVLVEGLSAETDA